MPTQSEKDLAYLTGYVQRIQTVAVRAVTKNDVQSMSPEWHAKNLLERGFNRAPFTAVDINRLAQYVYEEANTPDSPNSSLRLVVAMTGKAELVAALTKALERVGVVIVDEEVE